MYVYGWRLIHIILYPCCTVWTELTVNNYCYSAFIRTCWPPIVCRILIQQYNNYYRAVGVPRRGRRGGSRFFFKYWFLTGQNRRKQYSIPFEFIAKTTSVLSKHKNNVFLVSTYKTIEMFQAHDVFRRVSKFYSWSFVIFNLVSVPCNCYNKCYYYYFFVIYCYINI